MKRFAAIFCMLGIVFGVNVYGQLTFNEVSASPSIPLKVEAAKPKLNPKFDERFFAQMPVRAKPPLSIQQEDLLAQADPKKDAPKEEVHGKGLVKPADLDARIKASWAKHGRKLMALPTVTATSFDCRQMGWVPPADNQGQCGDCWVFSGVDPCAAAFYKSGKLKAGQTLSKQMALDCKFRDACGGGWPEDAINWIRDSGCATDADYGVPYHEGPGTCKSVDASKLLKIKACGYVSATSGMASYQELKNAMVAYGVLSICYDASGTPVGPPSTSKVWKGTGGRSVDHAIKCVGFDDTLGSKGAILCWNQWYGDDRDFWWAEYGANELGDSLMWVDAGDPPIPPVPPVPPSPDGAPTITSPLAVTCQVGQPFLYQITATNSPMAFIAAVPTGWTFDVAKGTISGTPTVTGVVNIKLAAGNAKGFGQGTLVVTVSDKPVPPPPPTDGFTGSVTYTYRGGVLVSVVSGAGGSLESDLKNAGVNPLIIVDLLKFISDLTSKQPYTVLIQDVLKIIADLVATEPKPNAEPYREMPRMRGNDEWHMIPTSF